MKKFKKLLACICFALIGCFVFAGCTVTEEQQLQVDELVSKLDNRVVVSMSLDDLKQLAVDKILYTNSQFEMKAYDNLHIQALTSEVSDPALSPANGYFSEYKLSASMYYRNTGKQQVCTLLDDYGYLIKSDSQNNVNYIWQDSTDEFKNIESATEMNNIWRTQGGVNLSRQFISYIYCESMENFKDFIKSVSYDGNLLECRIVSTKFNDYETGKDSYLLHECKIVFEGDYLKSLEIERLSYYYSEGGNYQVDENENIVLDSLGKPAGFDGTIEVKSNKTLYTCKYENIDFTALDAKVAEIEAEYLTQE